MLGKISPGKSETVSHRKFEDEEAEKIEQMLQKISMGKSEKVGNRKQLQHSSQRRSEKTITSKLLQSLPMTPINQMDGEEGTVKNVVKNVVNWNNIK